MELTNEVLLPGDEDEAVRMSVRDMLRAASLLMTAADMADDGEQVDHYINGAIRLRDLASALLPDQPSWPANVIQFIPRGR